MGACRSHAEQRVALTWVRSAILCAALVSVGCRSAPSLGAANGQPLATPAAGTADPNRGCRLPARERTGEAGCWLTAETQLGPMDGAPLFWHLYTYPTSAAAEASRGARGAIVESFGRHWLFTIEAEGWRPGAGERVAVIGPLAVKRDTPYTARYMEAAFPPGYQSVALGHRHSGVEAWYVLTGAQCLETPAGPMVARAGEGVTVHTGTPMAISGVGPETRRSVLLVLHPTAEPWVTSAPDWAAKGLCPK